MLDILYGIYNDAEEHLIQKSRVIDENGNVEEISSFGYEHMRSMGLTVNDVIAPTTFEVNRDYLLTKWMVACCVYHLFVLNKKMFIRRYGELIER